MKVRKSLNKLNLEKIKITKMPKFTMQTLINILTVIVGCFIFSIGINSFMIPGNLGEGGIIGVALILFYAFEFPTAITMFLVNAVLLVLGFKFLSRFAMYYTILTIPLISIMLWLTESWVVPTDQILIQTVFGGFLVGVGIGLVLRIGATTAGTTILAQMANKFFDVSVPFALLVFDLIIVMASLTVLTIEQVLLTVIALYIAMKTMDFIIEGMNPKKAITIITERPEELGSLISTEIKRGVTIMNGRGFYTKKEKDILYVVINRNQLTKLKRLIKREDENAFVVVHDVNSVLGNYFI
ncbi:MAG TPA: YitT family protein [Aliicoccus persicus]|uniref:YitT family protein n=1 Tax=Aliicoccus persicus TaxID=930138 RepID=A0A921B5V6_9STAP|nr:YitT family protein [Aliicoccus persicus]